MALGDEFDILRPQKPASADGSMPTVLIIDDDEQIRRTLALLLKDRYKIEVAESGLKGLTLMNDSVSVVVLDVKMADLDGFETCARIRQEHGEVPVIFHTAYQDKHDLADVINSYHPFGYVPKGESADRILEIIEDALKEKVDELTRLQKALVNVSSELRHKNHELERAKAQIEDLSRTDELTGVLNRRGFFDAARDEISRARRRDRWTLSVLMIDVDRFKEVNDRFGHPAGDTALKGVANAIRASVREIDRVGRIGGEEFCLLLPDTPLEGARAIAERLRKRVEMTDVGLEQANEVRLTLSVGVTSMAGPIEDEDPLGALIQRADAALYRAKSLGRNRIELEIPTVAKAEASKMLAGNNPRVKA